MTQDDRRVPGLDGIRGLAALYVVVHHCRLLAFPGYPADTGPAALGWLIHGRLAVVVFITLSGFSLALAPARNGWLVYARRRARRILPAYWAALALSFLIAAAPPAPQSILIYGLLLQDFVAAPAPNGAFWSIAVEATLYVAFPLIVLARRRIGAIATLAAVTVPVVVTGLLVPGLATGARATGYTWELAPLFTLGVLAAGVVTARDRPWFVLSALAAAPVLTLIAVRGSVWTITHYYWLDLAIGPAIALFLAGVATRRVALLDCRPLRALGGFSYSLYLIHMPIVALISTVIVTPHTGSRRTAFAITVLLAVPLCLIAARLFAAVFETPFQRRPDVTAGRAGPAATARPRSRRPARPAPGPAPRRR
ncbi:acyltransferase [Actinoplanes bogorensis]|uniref:Acyltransferase n=1 Tax=Paractinoplanes bogorensis TaxID=1610840 RepID=A0ABS5YN79_9ACTN|nr:acyltransferase [Actinoplanes bogorensis]MBU2664907.1 acyltransferase [Actinoplanes bogorensis]